MTITPDTLDHLKTEVAAAVASRLGRYPHDITSDEFAIEILDTIDDALVEHLIDLVPFAVGSTVTGRLTGGRGTVVRRGEHNGELHTVVVRWDDAPGDVALSPRELEEVTP